MKILLEFVKVLQILNIVKQELNLYLHASSKIISFDLAQNLVMWCLYSAVEENKNQLKHMA